jgi:predicted dehydrogenase
MKILVVGCGSIGQRHIKNLNYLGYDHIDAADVNREHLEFVSDNFRVRRCFDDYKKVVKRNSYDIGLVSTPPAFHIPVALDLASRGINLFIEKPLSNSLEKVEELLTAVSKNNVVAMVGYNQRFNAGIQELRKNLKKVGTVHFVRAELGQYLPDWRQWQDYRKNYTARKELGGGILLDGSHEIDYVLWLIGKKVKHVKVFTNRLSSLDINVEDCVDIYAEFETGAVATIHLDMIERGYNRYCKIAGEKGTIKWDFSTRTFSFYDGENKTTTRKVFESFDMNQTYIDEMKHFIDCIAKGHKPLVSLKDAVKVLEIVCSGREGGQ